MTTNGKQDVIAAIFTGYLSAQMGEEYDEEYIQLQREKFGYDPQNFHDKRFLETDRYRVRLDKPNDHASKGPNECLLAIAGSTEHNENTIADLMGSGLIVGRYSTFYRGPSMYSGNYPEEGGYALDIPKDVDTVRSLLTDEVVLDALVQRNQDQIRVAINELNKDLPRPVCVTPYLAQALRFGR
jgi:hypothetical protein